MKLRKVFLKKSNLEEDGSQKNWKRAKTLSVQCNIMQKWRQSIKDKKKPLSFIGSRVAISKLDKQKRTVLHRSAVEH